MQLVTARIATDAPIVFHDGFGFRTPAAVVRDPPLRGHLTHELPPLRLMQIN